MQWQCPQCGVNNLDFLDACRVCGIGKDGFVKNQEHFENWKGKTGNSEIERPLYDEHALSKIIVSTGDIKEPYQILDAIFALDCNTANFFYGSANPSEAFNGVKEKLRQICLKMGGDAIINCQFEYRISLATTAAGAVTALLGKAVGANISEKSQAIEIFAYGTAVKLIKREE